MNPWLRAPGVLLVAAAAWSTTAVAGAAARADTGVTTVAPEPSVTRLTAPQLRLDVVTLGIGFRICATGTAAVAGGWRLTVDGTRSDGSVVAYDVPAYGATFGACREVAKNLTLAGEFRIRFGYTGPGVDRPHYAFGGGTWDLLTGDHTWDTGN